MVQLVFTATDNVPKLAEVINGITAYDLYDSFRIATEISKGIIHKFSIEKSIEEVYKLVNSTMPAGTLNWHFVNSKTGDIFGGTSGKKEIKEEKPVKENFVLTIYAVSGERDSLRNALGSALKIDKDEASALVTTIEKEVKRNGLWRSTWVSIDISAWTAANLKDEWSIYDDNTNELIGSSGKKSKGNKKESKINSEYIQELKNTSINAVQSIVSYCEKLEVELAKVYNQNDTLLKEREELYAKLDVLSDKFIKLKSILD